MMDGQADPTILVDEETYESKAIAAYLQGSVSLVDLQASLELGRAQTYRMIDRYKRLGEAGLKSGKIGNKNRSFSGVDRARILAIIRANYPDFGPTLACEKLREKHEVDISEETLRRWMKDEGLWKDRRGRQPRIFSPRPPRERRGELVQVDGSYHRWFEKRGDECCLIVFIDDATSELMMLRFVEHENSFNYMTILKSYIEKYGRPRALFSDRHSIFRATNTKKTGDRTVTQFARACGKLDIQVICAKTPQSKGRVERANRTLQDRLVKELRLHNISTMEEANGYLETYRRAHNAKFGRAPLSNENAHLPKPNFELTSLLTYTVQRKVFKDLSVSFNKTRIILDDSEDSRRAIGKQVTVALPMEGELEVLLDEVPLPYRIFDKIRRVGGSPAVVDHKQLGAALTMAQAIQEVEPHQFQRNAHVMAGFRKQFQDPDDLKSRDLRDAPPDIRRKHNGRARSPLRVHPVVILESRLHEGIKEL